MAAMGAAWRVVAWTGKAAAGMAVVAMGRGKVEAERRVAEWTGAVRGEASWVVVETAAAQSAARAVLATAVLATAVAATEVAATEVAAVARVEGLRWCCDTARKCQEATTCSTHSQPCCHTDDGSRFPSHRGR